MFKKRFFRSDFLFGELFSVRPLDVVEVDGIPIPGDGDVLNAGILCVTADWSRGELLRFSLRIGDRSVAQFQNETAVANVGVGVLHGGFRVGVIDSNHCDRHGIRRQYIYRTILCGTNLIESTAISSPLM